MSDRIILVCKDDLTITWFNGGGGAGGQHKNRHNNCCRITHDMSGAIGIGTKERSAHQNQKLAFEAMMKHPKMRWWLSAKLKEIRTGETLEQRLEKAMQPKNLKIEGIDEKGQWVEIPYTEEENSQ
jgi:protein subunit release factor B